jgi:hypothetical protein
VHLHIDDISLEDATFAKTLEESQQVIVIIFHSLSGEYGRRDLSR